MSGYFHFKTNRWLLIKQQKTTTAYIDSIIDENRRKDCAKLVVTFSQQTGFPAKMWGTAIVGFGSYHYKYESGREGDAPLAGFSSRTNVIVLYLNLDEKSQERLLPKLGNHKIGKSCIYIQKLADVDMNIVEQMINGSVAYTKQQYPS